jgi:regulator of cell morphogenesis and NO signaling
MEITMSLPKAEFQPAPQPETMTVASLVAHILANFHARHRAELPDLVALARKVENVHHDVPEAPLGLADALEHISDDLEWHMQKEEQVLFPAMLQGVGGAISHPIAVMRGEHESHVEAIAAIEALTRNFAVPDGACGNWQRLFAGARSLCADLREHMRIENDILFPRFEIAAKAVCTCAHD